METDKLSLLSQQKKREKKPSKRPPGGAHLDPLVGSDAAHSDGGLRPVQQNLQLAALGVLAGADADGDHPAGTLLAWQTHTHAPIRRGHGRRHPGRSVKCDRVGISFCSVQWFSFTNLCILFMCCVFFNFLFNVCVLTLCSVSLSFYLLPGIFLKIPITPERPTYLTSNCSERNRGEAG